MQRSILVLLDFSKAYDTVWRQRLLLCLLEQGVPAPFVRWLKAFLENRQASVRFNNTIGGSRFLHQGLPQGSVLAPLLFILYINNLALLLPRSNVNAMFADDVAILATSRHSTVAQKAAQEAVNIVSKWSKEWKLTLNATKSEVSFFSNWTKEANWHPVITINGKPIPFNPTPRLLGVTLDRQLTFTKHTTNVTKAASSSCRILAALSNSEWGWRKQYLTKIYFSHVKSKLDYAGPAWQGNLQRTNINILERTQNKALRLITGQFKSTPIPSLRAEAGIPSYETQMYRNAIKSVEKAKRLPSGHPRRLALEASVKRRVDRGSWIARADEVMKEYNIPNLAPRKSLRYHDYPPWEDGNIPNIYPEVPDLKGRGDTPERKKSLVYKRIRELNANYIIYSDGSASGGVANGGAAAIVTLGDPESPTIIDTLKKRGSPITCSFAEEVTAMHLATDWVIQHCSKGDHVLVCTDSQSMCQALSGKDLATQNLRVKLQNTAATISVQWIPGHSDIAGNEMADMAAKAATTLDEPPVDISYGSICSYINSKITDTELYRKQKSVHERTNQVYRSYSKKKEETIITRKDQVLLARIRSGHHWLFGSYQQLVDPAHDPKCQECGAAIHDLQHWFLHCPATSHIRQRLVGTTDWELDLF